MALRLTLRPNETIILNGCLIRNAGRRQSLHIEGHADVIRGRDMLRRDEATTPVTLTWLMIQTCLTNASSRSQLLPLIQKNLGDLATVFGEGYQIHVFEAANHVSQQNFYRAICELRPLRLHEARLMSLSAGTAGANASGATLVAAE